MLLFLAERRAELLQLAAQHVALVAAAVAIAVAVGIPVGVAMTRRPRLARPLLAVANVAQTIPSLALFGFLIPVPLIGGIGARSAVVALALYALLPILRNTYTGLRQVDAAVLDAATGMGMTAGQRLRLVELPLALPVILGGVRVAAVIAVGTATIAAAIGAGGLGTYVFRGIATVDHRLILAGAVPSALLALLADALLGRVEHSPRPARAAALLGVGTVVAAGLLALGAREGGRRPVVVGSKNFTEQVVLGEIVAGWLERRGFAVDRRLNLGGTTVCHEAVRAGQLDAYVEYTGTALTDILKQPARSDPALVHRLVRAGYAPLGLRVGAPLGFNNTFALVMRPAHADALGVGRLSDLAPHAPRLRLGLFGEFLEREDGLPGLARAYGLRFGPPPREMDLGLLYPALEAEQVDLVVGSATDGLIAARGLRVLEDDRHYFPPYDAVVVANAARLADQPELASALDALAGRLDEPTMRRLNHAVDGARRSPSAVAREWLEASARHEGDGAQGSPRATGDLHR
jgi:osmoprotectant transport system permease protein